MTTRHDEIVGMDAALHERMRSIKELPPHGMAAALPLKLVRMCGPQQYIKYTEYIKSTNLQQILKL